MAIRVSVNTDLGLVVLIFEGVVTVEDFASQVGLLVDSPEYALLPLALVDMTATLEGSGAGEIIRQQARRAARNIDAKIDDGAKLALVSTRDEFFGLGRMYQALRDDSPVEVGVFRSRPEAEQWLGLPAGYEEDLTVVI